jgi:hypothetical protein
MRMPSMVVSFQYGTTTTRTRNAIGITRAYFLKTGMDIIQPGGKVLDATPLLHETVRRGRNAKPVSLHD